jgi:hypothetical protein
MLQMHVYQKQKDMKKINRLVFRNATISDLSAIKGGRTLSLFDACSFSRLSFHNDSINWWPSKFPEKYGLHELDKINIEKSRV